MELASIDSGFDRDADEFGIEISFERNTPAPARVFKAMSMYIDAFESIDAVLLSSVSTRIRPLMLLEDIEAGSVRTWLKNTLESIDDEALKSGDYKKIIGSYLVRGKRILVNFMDKKITIESPDQITALQTELLTTAEKSDVLGLATYRSLPTIAIVESLRSLSSAHQSLMPSDSAKYLSDASEMPISMTFSVAPEQITDLLVREEHSSLDPMILKVKKPDFIGDSMWDFIWDGRTLSMKIHHQEWLHSFRNGDILLRPGDSLRAKVKTTVRYGFDNEVVGVQHDLLEVLAILHGPDSTQMFFNN